MDKPTKSMKVAEAPSTVGTNIKYKKYIKRYLSSNYKHHKGSLGDYDVDWKHVYKAFSRSGLIGYLHSAKTLPEKNLALDIMYIIDYEAVGYSNTSDMKVIEKINKNIINAILQGKQIDDINMITLTEIIKTQPIKLINSLIYKRIGNVEIAPITILLIACTTGRLDIVEYFLTNYKISTEDKSKAIVSAADGENHIAAIEIVRKLLEDPDVDPSYNYDQ